MSEIIIPGEGYDPDGTYIPPTITQDPNGGYTSKCSWPYAEVTISYTRITITDPVPASIGQPYIPPSLPRGDANENAGWGNSSARSAQPLGKSQRFVFSPGHDDRGFFVGLGAAGKDMSHPAVFAIGISCLQSGVTVTEGGENKATLAVSITPLDEISIEIATDGSITCKHSNGSLYYSLVSFADSVYIYAQGYQAQDVLLSARIEDFTSYTPAPPVLAIQESVGIAGEFLIIQESVGIATPDYFLAIQESVGFADSGYDSSCDISGECFTVAGLSNADFCAISGETPCCNPLLNNDDIPPRLNSTGFLIMPDIGAIDGGGMIATCEISAEDISGSLLSDVDNYCAIGGFDGSQKAELKNSPAGYIWVDDSVSIVESSSFLRDVLINLYSSLDFIDSLSLFKDIAVGLIEINLIYDVNDIIADKDILLEETCNLLESLELNINGLPDYSGGTAWVINMETGATSLFLDYDYNSFMTSLTGEVYGVCKDGVYLLNGTGSATPMSAIDYGIHRFGSETKKMIPHFYASVASTGRLILKLAVGECEYEYYAMSSSEYLDKHRIDIGKGIGVGKRFIFANPVLIAPEGVEIKELEMLEYLPVAFDRRK